MAAKDLTKAQLFLIELERERHDRSYLQPKATIQQELAERAARDRDFFNAGRYYAGDRDKDAVKAWRAIGQTARL